jgi:hypothetical protein
MAAWSRDFRRPSRFRARFPPSSRFDLRKLGLLLAKLRRRGLHRCPFLEHRTPLPARFFLFLAGVTVTSLLLVETVKRKLPSRS